MLHGHCDHAHRLAPDDGPLGHRAKFVGTLGGDLGRAHRACPHGPARCDTGEPGPTITRSTQTHLTTWRPRRTAAAGHPLQLGQLPQLATQRAPESTRSRTLRLGPTVIP